MDWEAIRTYVGWSLWGIAMLVGGPIAAMNYALVMLWLAKDKESPSHMPAIGTLAFILAALALWWIPGAAPLWCVLATCAISGSDAVPSLAQAVLSAVRGARER